MRSFKQTLFFTRNIDGIYKDSRETVFCYRARWENLEDDKRKSWKHFITISRPCGSYESGIVNIYSTKQKDVYALVSYYDGSFYPLICYSKLNDKLLNDIREYKEYRKRRAEKRA